MISFILAIITFHLVDFWLLYEYQKTKKIDFENITSFESMLFWPMLLLEIGVKNNMKEKPLGK